MIGKIMKTLVWYRRGLRFKIIENLNKRGHYDIAELQEEYLRQEGVVKNQVRCSAAIDIHDQKHFGLNIKVLKNTLPPYKEVNVGEDLFALLDKKTKEVCSLGRYVDVLWSGGLDSTATLLLLKDRAEKDQLRVIMSEGSIEEYPLLYDKLVKHLPHVVNQEKNFRAEMKKAHITVNANAADTLFGGSGQDLRNNNYFAGWPLHLKVLPWYKWRFTWIEKTLRDMAGCVYDNVIVEDDYIPQCVSLFDDWDVIQWFINKNIRYEMPVIGNSKNQSGDTVDDFDPTKMEEIELGKYQDIWESMPPEARLCQKQSDVKNIPLVDSYKGVKMPLRDYIAKQTGDKDYAYNKLKVMSYSHGQVDMYIGQCLNMAVCDDGEIIRRKELDEIDPFDFITP